MQQVKTWPCIVHLVMKIYQIILNFGTHMAWLYIPWGLNMWNFESRWLLSFFSLQSINSPLHLYQSEPPLSKDHSYQVWFHFNLVFLHKKIKIWKVNDHRQTDDWSHVIQERGHPKMSTGKFWLIRIFFPKMSTGNFLILLKIFHELLY